MQSLLLEVLFIDSLYHYIIDVYPIYTPIHLGQQEWPIEITLTNRENMLFRMLIGRAGIDGRYIVDPTSSYRVSRQLKKTYRSVYNACR